MANSGWEACFSMALLPLLSSIRRQLIAFSNFLIKLVRSFIFRIPISNWLSNAKGGVFLIYEFVVLFCCCSELYVQKIHYFRKCAALSSVFSQMCFICFNGYLTLVVDFNVDLFKRAFRYVYFSFFVHSLCRQFAINSIARSSTI